jgi:hypothetical protein
MSPKGGSNANNDATLATRAVTPNGVVIFHDYDQERWPAISEVLDAQFPKETLYVHSHLAWISGRTAKQTLAKETLAKETLRSDI